MRIFRILALLLLPAFLVYAEDLIGQLASFSQEATWIARNARPKITREALVQSIELARSYMLNHQKSNGSFIYALNLESGEIMEKDNQVRQAGALWGLSSLNRDRFNEPTRRAVLLGLDFFNSHAKDYPKLGRCLSYPNTQVLSTGTVALYCLSVIEFLVGQEKYLEEKVRKQYREMLDYQLAFLQSMELKDGSWGRECIPELGIRESSSSPYYDGEALLAYCKAARYLGYDKLKARIDYALPKLIAKYTVDAWKEGGNPDLTKGFFQWGCMSMAEYLEGKLGEHTQLASEAARSFGWWEIHFNDVVHRAGNTGYAVEGLVSVWRIAKLEGDAALQARMKEVIEEIMSSLMTWQYQGPYMKYNKALSSLKKAPAGASGGITMTKQDLNVRIDVVQHQLHAMLMMLKYMY